MKCSQFPLLLCLPVCIGILAKSSREPITEQFERKLYKWMEFISRQQDYVTAALASFQFTSYQCFTAQLQLREQKRSSVIFCRTILKINRNIIGEVRKQCEPISGGAFGILVTERRVWQLSVGQLENGLVFQATYQHSVQTTHFPNHKWMLKIAQSNY